MKYSKIKWITIENGTGVRISLFVSGCRNNCKGCFNKEAQDFNFGSEFTIETINEIVDFLNKNDYVAGLTILGGEPMEQENQVGILPLILAIKEKCKNKNIWIYTGYRLEDFNINGRKYIENVTEQILNNIDVLVDGPFIEEQKNISLSFRGSENQRILYKNVDF